MPSRLTRYFQQILKGATPIIILLFAFSCATIVPPSGGPKDVTPPKLTGSQPKNLSTNFKGNKLIIDFDEYVQLKTPEKFLLISPPLSKLPDIKTKGRSIIIKLQDSLRANTTYNFYLGDAIVDLAENNPLTNFNFAFSTGPTIDSLSLSGIVSDAFTRMPAKGALVMLYTSFDDSVPMKQIPTYVSRTNDNGSFTFNSLASGKYRAVALIDGNNDYMYDLPTEMVGFSSDSVMPSYSVVKINDTIIKLKDSVAVNKENQDNLTRLSIDLFPEPDSTQHILKSVIASKNRLAVYFRYPVKSPGFKVLNAGITQLWAIKEWNTTKDSLNAWLLNPPDTLHLEISDHGVILDTVDISTTLKATGKPRNSESVTKLKYSSTAGSGKLEYDQPLILSFTNPVKDHDFGSLILKSIVGKDTTIIIPEFSFTDSIHRQLLIKYKWDATASYYLKIPKNSFVDIYNDSCDNGHVSFQMKPMDDYGNFAITISRIDNSFPVIIQLLTDKGALVAQRIITTEKRVDFGLLAPGKYGLKAIMDTNKNGRWDTGNLIRKIQPEKVLIHPKTFSVRTNWELEETWDL